MPICVFTVLILLLAPLCAGAQEAGSIYAVGGAGVNRQDGASGVSPVTYVTAPGGTTIGWLAGGGVFLTPRLAVDAEVSSTGWMTASEPSRYGYTYHEERRDRFFTLGARFAFPAGLVSIEPVAGVVFTTSDAWTQADRDLSQVSSFPGIEVGGRFEHPLDTGVGIMAGLDVRIGGRHFAAQPSFRVMQTAIDTGEFFDGAPPREIGAIYPGGYPGWTLRAGIALRGDF